jgi:hypothetical protein
MGMVGTERTAMAKIVDWQGQSPYLPDGISPTFAAGIPLANKVRWYVKAIESCTDGNDHIADLTIRNIHKFQCRKCGRILSCIFSSDIAKRMVQLGVQVRDFDELKHETWVRNNRGENQRGSRTTSGHIPVMRTIRAWTPDEYHAYIASLAWKKKSREARRLAGNKCQICSCTSRLSVHHNTYIRLGNEDQCDLIVLCGGCHGLFHHKIPRPVFKDVAITGPEENQHEEKFREILQSRHLLPRGNDEADRELGR